MKSDLLHCFFYGRCCPRPEVFAGVTASWAAINTVALQFRKSFAEQSCSHSCLMWALTSSVRRGAPVRPVLKGEELTIGATAALEGGDYFGHAASFVSNTRSREPFAGYSKQSRSPLIRTCVRNSDTSP